MLLREKAGARHMARVFFGCSGSDANDTNVITQFSPYGLYDPDLYNVDATPYESLMLGLFSIRAKDGKKLKMVFQTAINAPRQKTQAIVKQACAKAGIDVEIKSVVASVYFSSDVGNPDTYRKFYTDIQMYTTTMGAPDPETFMRQFLSPEVAAKDNKWQGRNITRWRNEEYDRTFNAAETELDPVKRAALFVKMNDLVIQNVVVIPVLWRFVISAIPHKLKGTEISAWDSNLWNLANWTREA